MRDKDDLFGEAETTPGEDDSQQADDDNIIIFHNKNRIEQFFSELLPL